MESAEMELEPIAENNETHTSAQTLSTTNEEAAASDGQHSPNYQELKPVDRGLSAWKLLITAFVFEALFWGFPISFGVFQNYYSTLPEFQQDKDDIALIGSIAQSLLYLGAPFSAMLTKWLCKYQRQQIAFGWVLCIFGLLAASFATSVPQLIVTQGVAYGVGFVVLTFPIISMINEWWVARKGMAFGLISAASGATGTVMPFILEALLSRYGYKTALRASAVAMAILTLPIMPLLKGRLPPSSAGAAAPVNWSFLREPLFWIYALSVCLSGFGFFFPSVFLPSYASAVGLQQLEGALLLAIMCIAQVLGQFAFGYLTDKRWSISAMASLCTLMSTAAVLTLWGLSKSLGPLVIFSAVYGFFAYGFGTMRVGMGKSVSQGDPSATFATFAIFVFMQGVGNALVGPISAGLITPEVKPRECGAWKYGHLVTFTGVAWFVSGLVICIWHLPQLVKTTKRAIRILRSYSDC